MLCQVKDNNHQTGNKHETCPYYEELDTIPVKRTCSEPVSLLENSGMVSVRQELIRDANVFFIKI